MKYSVTVLPEADDNVNRIYLWIAERSPEGARRWYLQFLEFSSRYLRTRKCMRSLLKTNSSSPKSGKSFSKRSVDCRTAHCFGLWQPKSRFYMSAGLGKIC